MASRQATLIQDISDFRVIIEPFLRSIIETYPGEQICGVRAGTAFLAYKKLEFDVVLKWIVCEELELQAGLFERAHEHNHPLYLEIYHKLINCFSYDLPKFLRWYIRMPRVYDGDNHVDVALTQRDLFITYYSESVNWPRDYEALLQTNSKQNGHLPR
jgi:hypothetical protein